MAVKWHRGSVVLLLLCVAALCVLARYGSAVAQDMPLPALTGRVVDRAELLSPSAEATISAKLDAHEQATGNQIVVVTLSDLMGRPIEDWGLMLGRGWRIGQAEKNNGIVFLIAPSERELRIEVGYGLEGDLPDAMADQIIRNDIVPHFKAGNMEAGILAGVTAIVSALEGIYQSPQTALDGETSWRTLVDTIVPIAFPIFFVSIFFATRLRRRWDPKRKRHSWHLAAGSGGSGGGFSSGRSGGGFSGGGGSFGGGGGSGRW